MYIISLKEAIRRIITKRARQVEFKLSGLFSEVKFLIGSPKQVSDTKLVGQ